jgi:hypothetical protein
MKIKGFDRRISTCGMIGGREAKIKHVILFYKKVARINIIAKIPPEMRLI